MAINLTVLRADTVAILGDWSDTLTFKRPTPTVVTGAGGETTNAYATSLVAVCDFQPLSPRSKPLRVKAGLEVQADGLVVAPHGSDIQVGDRFTKDSMLFYIKAVPIGDEDKVVAYVSKQARDDG